MREGYVTVVSGMPRSGTSLMMQMLAAGGMAVVTDGKREADRHNPRGYFEDERVKRLAQDASWIGEARGKAVKIIYRLLRHLPGSLEYRVVFMERDLNEVFDSQQAMLGSSADSRESTVRAMGVELDATKKWVADQVNMACLYVPHGEVLRDPGSWARRVARFLDRELDEAAMAAVVDPELYRNPKSQTR